MSEFFKSISDDDEIRQGDIIRKLDMTSMPRTTYGFILTADCDIAQRKAGERYTWLQILPVAEYIDGPWAREQLKKLSEKHAKNLCDYLNAQIKKVDASLLPLNPEKLADWLAINSPQEILTAVTGAADKPDPKTLQKMTGLAEALKAGEEESSLSRLKQCWLHFGTDAQKQRDALRSAFSSSGGFQDFFVIPELPKTNGYGFVVMLRSISTVMASELYLTEQDARIQGDPNAFHRLGRLHDGIRFAIAQKVAFLFSRIGLPKSFESACEAATEMLIDENYPELPKKV